MYNINNVIIAFPWEPLKGSSSRNNVNVFISLLTLFIDVGPLTGQQNQHIIPRVKGCSHFG